MNRPDGCTCTQPIIGGQWEGKGWARDRQCIIHGDKARAAEALLAAKADAWDEGAIWGFDERGPVDGTHLQLVPDDNPYRSTTPHNNQESNT